MRKLSILSLCCALMFCLCFAAPVNAASEEDAVLQVAVNFVKAMNENDSELVASLWYQNPKTTYFNPGGRFLTRGYMVNTPGGGENFTLNHPEVTMVGKDAAIITGYFTIMKFSEATGISTEDIKETMVVEKIGGKWLIVHEHSTFIP